MDSKLQLKNWGLPQCVLDQYKKNGLTSMFRWQADCLSIDRVLGGRNLVYAAPTSAGKTLVVEILLLKRILETGKKALFILPFVSVAREKLFHMRNLFEETGIRVDGYMGGHAPTNGFSSVDIAVCTIEKANGLINRLIEEKNIDQIGMLVVDELHMVGDEGRGYILELLLTKIRFMGKASLNTTQPNVKTSIQIVGMSATLPNLSLLADWLDAALYVTDFRPVPLQRCLKIGSTIYDDTVTKIRDFEPAFNCKNDEDNLSALCYETLDEGNSVLVFCPTKNWCEKLADNVAHQFYDLNSAHQKNHTLPRVKLDLESLKEIFEQLKQSPVGVDQILNRTLPLGVAYHHAGLTTEERDIVEAGFRIGAIRVLIATSTLSSGVNLPARRVIIRTPTFNRKTLDVRTYLQMTGRAGRKGVDQQGESILICRQNEQTRGKSLLTSKPLPVKSCLIKADNEELTTSMKRAILEIIVNGIASTYESVMEYTNCTLLSAQIRTQEPQVIKGPMTRRRSSFSSPGVNKESGFSQDVIENCVKWLMEHEFVHVQESTSTDGGDNTSHRHIVATQLGRAALLSSLPTSEALTVLADLHQAMKALSLDTELHLIYLVTPIFCYNEWTGLDWYQYLNVYESLSNSHRNAADLIGVTEQFLLRMASGAPSTTRRGKQAEKMQRLLGTHRRFYAALALHDLVQETPLPDVCTKYSCNRGMLQQLQQSAASFAGMVTTFCQELGWWSLEVLLREFQTRLAFGVQRELMDLMQISLLNSQRARALYTAGLTTCQQVSDAQPSHIELVLRNATHFQTNRKTANESDWEVEERRKQRNVHITGKRGITELEAAQLIVNEAKKICGISEKQNSSSINSAIEDKPMFSANNQSCESYIKGTESYTAIQNVEKVGKILRKTESLMPAHSMEKNSGETMEQNNTNYNDSSNSEKTKTKIIENRHTKSSASCANQYSINNNKKDSLVKKSRDKRVSDFVQVQEKSSKMDTQMYIKNTYIKEIPDSGYVSKTLTDNRSTITNKKSQVSDTQISVSLVDVNSKNLHRNCDLSNENMLEELSLCDTQLQLVLDNDSMEQTSSFNIEKEESPISSDKKKCDMEIDRNDENYEGGTQKLKEDGESYSKVDANELNPNGSEKMANMSKESMNMESEPKGDIESYKNSEQYKAEMLILKRNSKSSGSNASDPGKAINRSDECSSFGSKLNISEVRNDSLLESEDFFADSKSFDPIVSNSPVANIVGNGVTIIEESPSSSRNLDQNIGGAMETSLNWSENDNTGESSPLNNAISLFLSPSSSEGEQQNDLIFSNKDNSSGQESPITLVFDAGSSDNMTSEEEMGNMNVPRFSNCSSDDEKGSKVKKLTTCYKQNCRNKVAEDSDGTSKEKRSNVVEKLDLSVSYGQASDMSTIETGKSSSVKKVGKTSLTDSLLNEMMGDSFSQDIENVSNISKKQSPTVKDIKNGGRKEGKSLNNSDVVLSPATIKAMNISEGFDESSFSERVEASEINENRSKGVGCGSSQVDGNQTIPMRIKDIAVELSPAVLKALDESFSPCVSANTSLNDNKATNRQNSACTNFENQNPDKKSKSQSNSRNRNNESNLKPDTNSCSLSKNAFSPRVTLGKRISQERKSTPNVSKSLRKENLKSALLSKSYKNEVLSPHISLAQQISSKKSSTPKSNQQGNPNFLKITGNSRIFTPLKNEALSPYVSLGQPISNKMLLEKSKYDVKNSINNCIVSDNSLEDLFEVTSPAFSSANEQQSKFKSALNNESRENLDKAFNFSNSSCDESFEDRITEDKIAVKKKFVGNQITNSKICTKKKLIADKNKAPVENTCEVEPKSRKRKSPNITNSPSYSKSSKITIECPKTPSNRATHEEYIGEEQLILSSQKSPKTSRKLRNKNTKARKSLMTKESNKRSTTSIEKLADHSLSDVTNTMNPNSNNNGFIASSQSMASVPQKPAPTPRNVTMTPLVMAPTPLMSQKLTASQTGLTIIDVCSHTDLFNLFMKEWSLKNSFSFAVATRSADTLKGKVKIGVPTVTSSSNQLEPDPDKYTDMYDIAGIAVCWGQQDAYYISLEIEEHSSDEALYNNKPEFTELTPPPVASDLSVKQRTNALKSPSCAFQHKNCISGAVCIKKQFKVLRRIVETNNAFWQDPTVAAWMLDPSAKEKTLIGLVNQFIPEDSHLLRGLNKCSNYGTISCTSQNDSSAPARIRACAEAICCYRVMKKLKQELKNVDMWEMYSNVEMPHIKSLALMEINGIGFDKDKCSLEITKLHEILRQLEKKAYKFAKKQFSIGSPTEVAKVLFGDLGLPVDGSEIITNAVSTAVRPGMWRKRGGKIPQSWSTKKEVLERLKKFHPLPEVILNWRQVNFTLIKTLHPLSKVSTFCKQTNTYRIHPECLTHSITGRVSVAEPNIQNVPKTYTVKIPGEKEIREESREICIRSLFIPGKDHVFVAADYSQLEIRIFAHLSGDEKLLRILNSDSGDVFKMIAAQWKGIEVDDVSAEERQRAKQICYGMLYGIGAKALFQQLNIDEKSAERFMESFLRSFPGVRSYIRTLVRECAEKGYVRTLLGRRRYLPTIIDSNMSVRSQAERQAVNTTVQGSAADVIKKATVTMHRAMRKKWPIVIGQRCPPVTSSSSRTRSSTAPGCYLVLHLHDELMFEVRKDILPEVTSLVRSSMEQSIKLNVKLPVKIASGHSWGGLKEYSSTCM